MNRRRLYRCVHDQKIAGVCSGVGEYFDIDPTWVRIVFLLGLFMGGVGFILYVVMAIIVPLEPEAFPAGPWQPGSDRWGTPAPTGAPSGESNPADAEGAQGTDPASAAAMGAPSPGPSWQSTQAWHAAYAEPRRERSNNAGRFFGAVLILIGAAALLNQYLPAWGFHNWWALFFLGLGALLVAGSLNRRNKDQ